MKNSKGITLIALIITIVVITILAGVTISTIQESNIIAKAKQAASTYQSKENEEKAILDSYVAMLEGENIGNEIEEENDSVVGKYYLLDEMVCIDIQEDGKGYVISDDNDEENRLEVTYSYNEETKIITMASVMNPSATIEVEYYNLKLNKVIVNEGYIYTTNGTSGLATPEDGVYRGVCDGNNLKIVITNGIMDIINEDGGGSYNSEIGAVWLFDNNKMIDGRDGEILFEVSEDGKTLSGFASSGLFDEGDIFTKVNE